MPPISEFRFHVLQRLSYPNALDAFLGARLYDILIKQVVSLGRRIALGLINPAIWQHAVPM